MLQISETDKTAPLRQQVEFTEGQVAATVREAALATVFYGDCSEADITLAKLLIQPEAIAPLAQPMQLTEHRFGKIPRVYIECLQDQAISPSIQKQMYEATPCQTVISMNTGHAPFFSAPEALAAHLLTLI